MNTQSRLNAFKGGYLLLAVLAATGLAGYGLAYLIVMPGVSPTAFVPVALQANHDAPMFGMFQAGFVLLYAFAFLPVSVLFTARQAHTNPYPLLFAGCLLVLSLLIQIFNNLPVLAAAIYPIRLADIPPDVRLYLHQVDSIRYLSYDVAGFSIAYCAAIVYALTYLRSYPRLAYAIFGSLLTFMMNVPCLWFAPDAAILLMVVSIFLFASVPLFLAKLAIE